MKQIIIFIAWAFTLVWAGNFVSFYFDVPTVVMTPAAIGTSLLVAIGPARLLAVFDDRRGKRMQAALRSPGAATRT